MRITRECLGLDNIHKYLAKASTCQEVDDAETIASTTTVEGQRQGAAVQSGLTPIARKRRQGRGGRLDRRVRLKSKKNGARAAVASSRHRRRVVCDVCLQFAPGEKHLSIVFKL